ncbi:hypothetical protein [Streptomyces spororaveus]|uniref:hypothetical protein n=1 Tax=Streptomyces spororaveus TaxID=284039 RepID=UPI0037963B1B
MVAVVQGLLEGAGDLVFAQRVRVQAVVTGGASVRLAGVLPAPVDQLDRGPAGFPLRDRVAQQQVVGVGVGDQVVPSADPGALRDVGQRELQVGIGGAGLVDLLCTNGSVMVRSNQCVGR